MYAPWPRQGIFDSRTPILIICAQIRYGHDLLISTPRVGYPSVCTLRGYRWSRELDISWTARRAPGLRVKMSHSSQDMFRVRDIRPECRDIHRYEG